MMGIISKVRNTAYLLLGHGIELGKETWDREYREGHWYYLRGVEQLPRYSIVAGYLQYFRPGGSVLDIGCGEGILRRMLPQESCGRYVGIDFSRPAIDAALAEADESSTFYHCDAVLWEPSGVFDTVIFNEALYYFYDPLGILRKYERALENDGIFIVSMYSRVGNTQRIWSKIGRAYPCLHMTKLKTTPGTTWIVKVLGREGMTLATALKKRTGRPSRTDDAGQSAASEVS